MDDSLRYALTHPLTLAGDDEPITRYERVVPQPDGNLLLAVLAVDR